MKNRTIRILAALLAAGVTLTSGSVTTFAAGRVVGGPSVVMRALDDHEGETTLAKMQAAYDAAEAIVNTTAESEAGDGTDVTTDGGKTHYVAKGGLDDLNTALASLKTAIDGSDETNAETLVTAVDEALAALDRKEIPAKTPTEDPEVTAAKEALQQSIDAANAAMDGIEVAETADEVAKDKHYVTAAEKKALTDAIADATEALKGSVADELTTAKGTLDTAITAFEEAAKKVGTKDEVTPPTETNLEKLAKAIEAAEALVADTQASEDGKGLKKENGNYWAKQADITTFTTAISEAKEVKVEENAAAALDTLKAAQDAFTAADVRKEVVEEGTDPAPDLTEKVVINQGELKEALLAEFDVIKLANDVELTEEVPVGREVVIDGQGNSFTDGVVRATTGSLKITAAGVELKNLGVDVDVVVAAGGEVILGADAKAASVTLDGGTVKITEDADISTLAITVTQAASTASGKTETMEILDALVKSEVAVPADKFVSVTKADGSAADDIVELPANVTPTPPTPTPTPGGSSSNDHDYFGTATWDEVKDKIADAKDGDTIKISGNGLKNFPASVARELKGKDITVEIRKNGVTYSINGLKIGSVDKLWYEFENLEGQLLTVSSSKPTNKPQNNNTVKPNPSTGR